MDNGGQTDNDNSIVTVFAVLGQQPYSRHGAVDDMKHFTRHAIIVYMIDSSSSSLLRHHLRTKEPDMLSVLPNEAVYPTSPTGNHPIPAPSYRAICILLLIQYTIFTTPICYYIQSRILSINISTTSKCTSCKLLTRCSTTKRFCCPDKIAALVSKTSSFIHTIKLGTDT